MSQEHAPAPQIQDKSSRHVSSDPSQTGFLEGHEVKNARSPRSQPDTLSNRRLSKSIESNDLQELNYDDPKNLRW